MEQIAEQAAERKLSFLCTVCYIEYSAKIGRNFAMIELLSLKNTHNPL